VNNLAPPSKLPLGSNYHLFKLDVRPAWEDPHNEKGGKWNILVPHTSGKTDSAWLYSVRQGFSRLLFLFFVLCVVYFHLIIFGLAVFVASWVPIQKTKTSIYCVTIFLFLFPTVVSFDWRRA
jgi:hypothetical protein